ncbi:MAG: hypothetical protein R3298_01165 [Gammaproteobacteria bacterium]|nr:hypothetical protein [Gammaproteobacteria bacterium]
MDHAKLIESLRVPELKSGTLPVELSPKALQQWRESLPLANLQETTRQVFTMLRDANRLKLPDKGRLLLLDVLRPQIDYISGALTKGAQGHAHPLPEKVTKLVKLNQELLSEAAIAHKIVARGLLGKRFLFGGGGQRQLATMLQATLHYLGGVVLESYRTYVPFPEGLWGEIHAAYALAEARNIDQLKSDEFSEGGKMTLGDTYKRLMLLALASPYHFERGTIDLLYRRLSEWSSACELRALEADGDGTMNIVIRLDGSAPPSFQVLEGDGGGDGSPTQVRVLDATPLITILEDEIERQSGDMPAKKRDDGMPSLTTTVLQMLRESWSGPTTRAETRYQGEVEVRIAIGLNAASYFLSHGHGATEELVDSGAPPERDDATEELSIEVTERTLDMQEGELVTTTEKKRDRIADMLLPQAAAAAWTENRRTEAPRSYTCRTQDFSASGCQLVCAKDSEVTISVGDLLCIGFDDTDSGRWKIGTARWIRQRSGQETQVGVRILANEGRGVKAGVCDDTGYVGDVSDCILLPGKEGVTLLTPRMPFATDKMVYMLDGEEEHFIRLGENIEISSRFGRFEFRPCTRKEVDRIQAERNRPVARLSKEQIEAMERGESVEKILSDSSGVWDGMRHDW